MICLTLLQPASDFFYIGGPKRVWVDLKKSSGTTPIHILAHTRDSIYIYYGDQLRID